jgi:predicted metal-dependent hydrolase
MQVLVEETKKLRRASASIRDGGIIHVKVPRHWPREVKRSTIDELVNRIQKKDAQERALLVKAASQARITITTQPELERYVRQINAETFNVPLGKVQIGWSRYNHLAQVNLRTKTMTVSKHCLQNAPMDALRYLIIHELAHYFESGHGPAFWALVGRHVENYRLQSRIMKAFHHQAVITEELANATKTSPVADITEKNPVENPTPLSKPRTKAGYASKPSRTKKPTLIPESPKPATPSKPQPDKKSLVPEFIRQLLLWGNN